MRCNNHIFSKSPMGMTTLGEVYCTFSLLEVYSVQNVQKVYVLLAYWEKRERGLCSLGP